MNRPESTSQKQIPSLIKEDSSEWSCQNGVWIKKVKSSESISFPLESYNSESYTETYWSRARANIILRVCHKYNVENLLEIGAGNGLVSIPLSKHGVKVTALEPIIEGAQCLAENEIEAICGTLDSIKSSSYKFSAVGIFDVLEHIGNTKAFLESITNLLDKNGLLIISVPSHKWLFSDFDSAIGHFRRYSKKSLRQELNEANYVEIEIRHAFATLVAPAFILRRLPYLFGRRRKYAGTKGVEESSKRLVKVNKFIDMFLYWLLEIESKIKFPFGLSIIAVFKKS
jgi:2-polyprenyl-3-methyl-5-hydroxy-6-metoxy-1,4-benzoquinol methylase